MVANSLQQKTPEPENPLLFTVKMPDNPLPNPAKAVQTEVYST